MRSGTFHGKLRGVVHPGPAGAQVRHSRRYYFVRARIEDMADLWVRRPHRRIVRVPPNSLVPQRERHSVNGPSLRSPVHVLLSRASGSDYCRSRCDIVGVLGAKPYATPAESPTPFPGAAHRQRHTRSSDRTTGLQFPSGAFTRPHRFETRSRYFSHVGDQDPDPRSARSSIATATSTQPNRIRNATVKA